MTDRYLTIAEESEHETVVNRSRFVCALAPTATEDAARSFLARVRARHPTASHHCYAYVIGSDAQIQKSSDDGEPGGTAGLPMLQMLTRRGIRNTTAVVSRYFGGTKLGAGGLIRAYGAAVGRALDASGTVTRQHLRLAVITADHQRAGRLENDLRATGREIRSVSHGERVTIELGLPAAEVEEFRAWLAQTTAGQARVDFGGEVESG
ncbi:YigZ family protein [Streptomyces sp. 4N509B]|uniref:YigZ family protein n=1 Tax=Streptomyces sp. 4N509B TaxID=3457413 RepID=UPI003FD62480